MTDGNTIMLIDRIEELEAKLAKALGALDEAVSLLALEALDEAVCRIAPADKDMMRKAGVNRIVTTLAELKGQDDG